MMLSFLVQKRVREGKISIENSMMMMGEVVGEKGDVSILLSSSTKVSVHSQVMDENGRSILLLCVMFCDEDGTTARWRKDIINGSEPLKNKCDCKCTQVPCGRKDVIVPSLLVSNLKILVLTATLNPVRLTFLHSTRHAKGLTTTLYRIQN